MSLDQETRDNVVLYRIEKAKQAYKAAIFNMEGGLWGTAANRLYYALFHAASSLLIAKGIPANTHRGFLTQTSLHLVKTGLITPDEGKLIRKLFELRHEDDYEDFQDTTEEDVAALMPQVKALIDKLVSLNKMYEKK